MGINGINDYSSFINNYKVPSIPSVSLEEVKKQDELKKASESQALSQAQSPVSSLQDISLPSKKRNDAAISDISLTFNKGDDFGYIGKDSDIYSLDVEKAISDMKQDDILKQYQFFVGSSNGSLVDNGDGIVIPKLN